MRIALFNHKGGVSKTTTTFNLGWMLASKGHRVILLDADPQCNLTGMTLGFSGKDLDNFYEQEPGRNFYDALLPAFQSRPVLLEAVECVPVQQQPKLLLLPGNIRLSEFEVPLGIAQELSGSLQTLLNLPGAMSYLIEKTAAACNADYVLIDMSPSLTSINQNLLMTSDYFIIPASPDYFSVMAIDSFAQFLPRWSRWHTQAQTSPLLQGASYPYPNVRPKMLGTVVQNYRVRGGAPTRPYQMWVNRVNEAVRDKLRPVLDTEGLLLPESVYQEAGITNNLNLSLVPDFNSLIARSQDCGKPVYALTDAELGQQGVILQESQTQRTSFEGLFSTLADKIIAMTANAPGV